MNRSSQLIGDIDSLRYHIHSPLPWLVHFQRMIDFHNFVGPGVAAGAFGVEVGTRHAVLLVEPGDHRVPRNSSPFLPIVIRNAQPVCVGSVSKPLNKKLPEAVDDQMSLVVFGPLRDVRMGADHNVGPGVDHLAGKRFFPIVGRIAFAAPVHVRE